ncbi:hypothetical protein HanIR_Chr13g0625361 [Helianthus annuus]|nr:hypothetical protein HanIR_Chr13g0625361 [Helianthus annuus]
MVNHHMSHSSTFSLVKFLMVPLRGSLLMTIQRLPNSPLVKPLLLHGLGPPNTRWPTPPHLDPHQLAYPLQLNNQASCLLITFYLLLCLFKLIKLPRWLLALPLYLHGFFSLLLMVREFT